MRPVDRATGLRLMTVSAASRAGASSGRLAGPADRPAAVRLRGLCKRFGDVEAVADIDLDIADGEFFCMLGPSGSGKTTVLRLLAGFETPTAGSIELAGRDVTRTPPFERDLNTVFQDYALFPHMTVAQNIAYGLAVKRVPKRQRAQRVEEVLASVRLDGFGGRRPSQLSGGQRQRVALARALVNRPSVLLLDEPLGALDLKLRQEMQLELKQLQRDVGVTFVFVTHDQDEALTLSDRIAVFAAGRIEQVGLPRTLYEHPDNAFVAGFVGTTNLLRGEVARAVLGQPGTWSVRPERLRVTDPSEPVGPGEQSAEGTLRDVVYAGAVTRLVVDLDAGAGVVASVPTGSTLPHDLRAGGRVRLAWDRVHARRVGDRTEPSPLEEPCNDSAPSPSSERPPLWHSG